jgi:hypothetical protein
MGLESPARTWLCIRAGPESGRCGKNLKRLLFVPAPDFSPGERVFKPAENDPLSKMRALALVAASQPVCDFFQREANQGTEGAALRLPS